MAQKTNQPELAAKYYSQLVKNCAGAPSDRPELARARGSSWS